MRTWALHRSSASAKLLAQLGVERGLSLDACLVGTGLSELALSEPTEIEVWQELELARNLVGALGDPVGLGADAGRRYHITTYGIWGFALISSPTLRSAISLGLRYLDLTFAFAEIRLETAGDDAALVFTAEDVPADVRDFLLIRDAVAVRTLQRELLATPALPKRAAFAMPVPPDAEALSREFGVAVDFRAPRHEIVFDAAHLDLPLPQANEHTSRQCETQCRELLERRLARTGFTGRVRDRLLVQPGRIPDMETVAAELCVSSRTLRRRLDAAGTSWRALVDEVREALAEELLLTERITLEETAERLGFSEVSNFIHAFKRWKGMPPDRYRRRRAGA